MIAQNVVGYIALPTELLSHAARLSSSVGSAYNQQNICFRVRELTLTEFVAGVSGALCLPR